MQYNAANGDLIITDNVGMQGTLGVTGAVAVSGTITAGASATVAGNLYLGSGTAVIKKVAAISVYTSRQNLAAGGVMSFTIPANTAPNFINVQASCRLGSQSQGENQYCESSRAVTYTNIQSGTVTIGSLLAGVLSWIEDGDNNNIINNNTSAIVATLVAGVDYDSTQVTTITMADRADVGHVASYDDMHSLTALCG